MLEVDFSDPIAQPPIRLRGRQQEWVDAVESDLLTYSRVLVVASPGTGKTTVFGVLGFNVAQRGGKMLVLENRDRLTRQTADRLSKETGLQVDVEMAGEHASPFAPIVVACVQSISRENRLTGFTPDHFSIVVVDEAHFALAKSYERIIRYFHYGADSLREDWMQPEDGTYEPIARIVGFTGTPDIGERRNLGSLFQKRSVDYSYLEAVQDGWLVGPVQKSIPVKIDLRKLRAQSGPLGMDFKADDLSRAIAPIIGQLADQIVEHASDRKTMAFLPSVECARMMDAALKERGVRDSWYVSGECLDVDEKTEAFVSAGRGSVLSHCALYVYGIDFPDVDAIGWFRATLSRAFYIQGVSRATRLLLPKEVLEACVTADDRLAAIANSSKRDFLVFDPLFVHERIDLLDAYDLYADRIEVKQKMKAAGKLTPEAAQNGKRDFLAALAKEARKHARKAARTIDPLSWALSIGDSAIANYVPETDADRRPVTPGQMGFFQKNKIDATAINCQGLASKIIGRYLYRMDKKLATASQLSFLRQLGLDDQEAAKMSARDASATIDRVLVEKRNR